MNKLERVADFVSERISLGHVALTSYVSTESILPEYGGIANTSRLPTTGSATRFEPGDILISNIRPYLKKVWVADREGGASNDIIVIRSKEKLNPQYLACLLKNDAFIDYMMTGAKGVKMPRGDIGSIRAYPAPYPNESEQQKIASCLSSLDELIAAQARKVDVLKAHRCGLMRLLFPSEGETQPRLRLPEFQSSVDWGAAVLNDVCASVASGKDKSDPEGRFDLYGSTGVIGKTRGATFEGSYVLVARVGANAGYLNKVAGKFGVTDNTLVLDLQRPEQLDFVFFCLQKIGLNRLVFGSGQPLITGGQLKGLTVAIPPDNEQQRVASVFVSLDDHITAGSQELEALKTHKKGLMQQLFPLAEALDA